MFISLKGVEPTIFNLRPQFIGKVIPFLDGKPYKVREYYCKKFLQFCNDDINNDIRQFFTCLLFQKHLLKHLFNSISTQFKYNIIFISCL